MQLTAIQIAVARRMLGLGRRCEAYRNLHYAKQPVPILEEMVALGAAIRSESVDNWLRRHYCYWLTRAAAEAVCRTDEGIGAVFFEDEGVI